MSIKAARVTELACCRRFSRGFKKGETILRFLVKSSFSCHQ
jgi:hypothetical protein